VQETFLSKVEKGLFCHFIVHVECILANPDTYRMRICYII